MLKDEIWQEIEKATGISDLKAKATSEEVQEVTLTKTKHFDQVSYDVMYQNIFDAGSKDGYGKGLLAGEEMPVKELKRERGWEFEGKNLTSLVEYLESNQQNNSTKKTEEIKKEFENDLEALRLKLSDKDKEIETLNLKHKHSKINSAIDNFFNAIPIEIPSNITDEKQRADYVKKTLDMHKTFFKSQYNFDLGDNDKIIAKSGEEVIKDELQNPLSIDSLVKSYQEQSFMPIKQKRKGRGDGDYTPTHNELADIRTREEFNDYLDNKKVKIGTSEADALFAEWNKVKQK